MPKQLNQNQKQRHKIDILLNVGSEQYFNFINSLETESTKVNYRFFIFKFLEQNNIDLVIFLKLSADEMRNEYKIVDSDKTIQIKYSVSKIMRAIDKYDKNGRPFYIINGAPAITVI